MKIDMRGKEMILQNCQNNNNNNVGVLWLVAQGTKPKRARDTFLGEIF